MLSAIFMLREDTKSGRGKSTPGLQFDQHWLHTALPCTVNIAAVFLMPEIAGGIREVRRFYGRQATCPAVIKFMVAHSDCVIAHRIHQFSNVCAAVSCSLQVIAGIHQQRPQRTVFQHYNFGVCPPSRPVIYVTADVIEAIHQS